MAELYETAVVLLEQQPLPGRSRIISHCVREIANSLPAVLAAVERTRLEYDKHLDDIANAWDRLNGLTIPAIGTTQTGSVPDPREALTSDFVRQVKDLIEKHKATRTKQIVIAERLFQANRPENLGDALKPILRQWIDLREWFVGHAHDGGKTDSESDWNEFKEKFILFEETILTLGQGFFATIADLDEMLQTATPDQVDLVVAHLGHVEHYRYFFERLNDPGWISAFKNKGIFRLPPPIEPAGIPRWAASEYLVRIADRATNAELVMDTLLETANALGGQSSPNPFVIRDLIDASRKLPAAQAARLIPRLKPWFYHEYGRYFWRRLGRFSRHLAEGGKPTEALTLVSALLAIERAQSEYKSVKSRIYFYDYCDIVKNDLPVILRAIRRPLFDTLCKILKTAARLSRRSSSPEEWDDNSSVWRPALTEEDDDDREDVRSILVSTTLHAAEYLLREGDEDLTNILEALESHRWLIFRRIALWLLSTNPSATRDMVAARLTQETLFRDRDLRMEYDALLKSGFSRLTGEEKLTILGWVETGPENVAQKVSDYEVDTGHTASPDDIERYHRQWQWRRLRPLHGILPDEWQTKYVALVEEFGEPEERPAQREARVIPIGSRSPRSGDELQALTPQALRDYLLTWEPDKTTFFHPTSSGLAEVLTSLAAREPERFASSTNLWEGLDPTYLHGILRGFARAIQEGRQFAWEPVLTLCSWVLEQPRSIPGRKIDCWEGDPDWGGTRWWMVEILRIGFQHEIIPFEFRDQVWRLLEALTNDPDPEPEDEEEDFGRPGRSMHRAINSIRGRAIEAIVFYPDWLKRHTGVRALPAEAKTVLDRHLDPAIDASLAIRSLYGRWFPWILVLDREWAIGAVTRIFDHHHDKYWLVAWDGFICFCDPYDEVFETLQPVYAQAIGRLPDATVQDDDTRNLRDERLAAHLMTFYWRGRYSLDEDNGLIRRFFASAPDRTRAEAIEYVGRSLERTPGVIETNVLELIRRLWEWRLEEAHRDPTNHHAELRAFGWCFGSGKFEARWAIENLLAVVRLTQSIDADFLVLERLPDHAVAFPLEVLRSVRILIEGQHSQMELSSWDGDLRRIFAQTREHPVPEIRQESDGIIELLGRFGHVSYMDLLSTET